MKDNEICLDLNKKTLIIVRGVPGSGKSTFAGKLKEYLTHKKYIGDAFESDTFL